MPQILHHLNMDVHPYKHMYITWMQREIRKLIIWEKFCECAERDEYDDDDDAKWNKNRKRVK